MMKRTKKTTDRSEWENIKGFDRTKREYIRLDCDAWLAAHEIREEGERRGKRNQPGASETLPDEMYNRIETWVRKRALACKEDVGKYIDEELANLHALSSKWGKQNPEIDIEARVTQLCQDLRAKAAQSVSDLDKQRAEYEEADRDLKNFRQRHRLSRVAHYPNSRNPSSRMAHWLWVLIAGIVESLLNASLLGSVSPGGVFEGLVIALVLTAVNVFLGLVAGQGWRYTHYGWSAKLSACFLVALCAVVALVWNGVAGHVRDVYVSAGTVDLEAFDKSLATALDTAVRRMMERPLWQSPSSAGLALIGFVVFVLSAYKMYTLDDPFPGYGGRHRKVESLRGGYQDALNAALAELGSTRDKANVEIEEIKNGDEVSRSSWNSALDKLRMDVDNYPANLRQYNKDLAYLLAAYRDANLAERTEPPPPFFAVEPTIDEDVIKPPEFSVPTEPEWGDIPTKAEAGFAQVAATYDELRKLYKMLDRVVEDYEEDEEGAS